jgi:AraC family transcriptional regulator
MEPKIQLLAAKKLVGHCFEMSFANDRTLELWRNFMPQRRLISNVISPDLYSIQIFRRIPVFKNLDPHESFEKWAAVEVSSFDNLPTGMQTLELHGGLYSVFLYKGKAEAAEPFYRHIFQEWLPASDYELDDRPQFAVMGEKYKNDDENSEEDIYIPIKNKKD